MALSDPDGTVLMVNPAYCALYGYPREEMIGHSFAIIFPPEHRDAAIEQYRLIFAASGGNAATLRTDRLPPSSGRPPASIG